MHMSGLSLVEYLRYHLQKPKQKKRKTTSSMPYTSDGQRRLRGGSGAGELAGVLCATTRRCSAEQPGKSHEWRKRQRKNCDEQRPAFQEWHSVDDDGVPDASSTSTGREGLAGETDWTGGEAAGCSAVGPLRHENGKVRNSGATSPRVCMPRLADERRDRKITTPSQKIAGMCARSVTDTSVNLSPERGSRPSPRGRKLRTLASKKGYPLWLCAV